MVPVGQEGVDKWAEWTDGCMDDAKIYTRGVQKIRGQMLPFLHWLSNRAGITAHNTVTYMQLIDYNKLGVSRLHALQLSSRQRYIA